MVNPVACKIANGSVDQQVECPLFTQFPPEIHRMIWKYSVAIEKEDNQPLPPHNFLVKHGEDAHDNSSRAEDGALETPVFGVDRSRKPGPRIPDDAVMCDRPDVPYHKQPTTSLLRTCKLIYLETWELLITTCEYEIPRFAYVPPEAFLRSASGNLMIWSILQMRPYQRQLLTSTYRLPGSPATSSSWPQTTPNHSRVENIRLTIRCGWGGGQGEWLIPPFEDPRDRKRRCDERGLPTLPITGPDWAPQKNLCCEESWGQAFRYLPRLNSLTVNFDVAEYSLVHGRDMVNRAIRDWRFPLGPRADGRAYLSAEGNAVMKTNWRSRNCNWNLRRRCRVRATLCVCPIRALVEMNHTMAGAVMDRTMTEKQIYGLYEYIRAMGGRRLGPRIFSWAVEWTACEGETWMPPKDVG